MRTVWVALPAVMMALCATAMAYAQVAEGQLSRVIDTRSAMSFGLLLSVGTIIAGAVASWVAVRMQVVRMEVRFEERTRAMCHTLDRHEREIEQLQQRK